MPGELVLDPFMGSGAFGVAAIQNGRNFAGNDTSQEALKIAQSRLVEVGGYQVSSPGSPTETCGSQSRVRKIDGGEAA